MNRYLNTGIVKPIIVILLCAALTVIFMGCSAKKPQGGDTPAETYNEHDLQQLSAFLEQEGANGIKNGTAAYGDRYSAVDPSTWMGIEWTDTAGDKRVLRADLSGTEGDLDLSGCSALEALICVGGIRTLDLSDCTSLNGVECSGNQLNSIRLTGCASLTALRCDHNELSSLDLSSCSALTLLRCEYNKLASLDLSCCTAIETLECNTNELSALNLAGCSSLKELRCHANQLAGLDLSSCAALSTLVCYDNPLVTLNVSGCESAIDVNCDESVEVIR